MLLYLLNQFYKKKKITTTIRYFQENVPINQLKNNHKKFFHSRIMLRFREKKVTKEEFYATKKAIEIQDVNTDNIVISKLIETKTNSKYLIQYLDKVKRKLVLIIPK